VATISREIKKIIYANLKVTSDDPDGQILFKLHDFGARGVSSYESSAIGGLAHLVNFMGTDTVPALVAAQRWYDEPMAGFSIPAAEHSTITSWGKSNEKEAYRNMLTQFAKPGKLVAVVSDSYNIYEAADKIWGQELRDEVLNSGATVVIRPDSGNPVSVVTTLLTILGERFGYTSNSKGYRVLHPSVRLIQGDGVDYNSIHQILNEMMGLGWSGDNIAFGMGGALLQKLDRDTFKWAMKANARNAYGQWQDVFKQPIHQPDKKSKAGILSVVRKQDGSIQTIRRENLLYDQDLLQPVFENGHILTPTTLKNVRENAKL
jgi:nicotinamide phosphoribosyltransferase